MAATGQVEQRLTDEKAAAPVVIIWPGGRVEIGVGYPLGEVLNALDMARRAALGVVLNPGQPETPGAA